VLQTELSDIRSKYDTPGLPQIDWPGSLTLNLHTLKGDGLVVHNTNKSTFSRLKNKFFLFWISMQPEAIFELAVKMLNPHIYS